MNLQWIHYPDLSGGVNLGQSPHTLQPNEMAVLINYYPYGTSLRRRGGNRKLSTNNSWTGPILGMNALRKSTSDNFLIVGNRANFARVVDDRVEELILSATIASNATFDPWYMTQFKDFLYAGRNRAGAIYRIDGNTVRSAGIAKPTILGIGTLNATGIMVGGTYQFVQTYGNQATGYESNPSDPVSVTITDNDSFDITSLALSSDPFVDMMKIYITYPNQEDFYYLAATVLDNNTTALNINVALSALGALANFDNGIPPTTGEFLAAWNERLWIADRRFLYFSETLNPEGFGASSIIQVYPDDGYEIRGIARHGDRLIIGKTDAMYYGTGTERRNWDFSHVLSDKHGLLAGATLKSAHDTLLWVGSGRRVYRADGVGKPVQISDPWVQSKLDALTDLQVGTLSASINPERGWYMILLPSTGAGFSTSSDILIYDYRYGVWSVLNVPGGGSNFTYIYDGPEDDAEGRKSYLLTSAADVFHFLDTTFNYDDDEDGSGAKQTKITCSVRTRVEDLGYPGFGKNLSRVGLLIPGQTGTVNGVLPVQVITYLDETSVASRLVGIDYAEPWKMFKLDPFDKDGRLGTVLQCQIEYSGVAALDLREIMLGINLLSRRPRLR